MGRRLFEAAIIDELINEDIRYSEPSKSGRELMGWPEVPSDYGDYTTTSGTTEGNEARDSAIFLLGTIVISILCAFVATELGLVVFGFLFAVWSGILT
jgi:hypothetical protein